MTDTPPKAETIERVKGLLRRDLMLGADARIEDDEPLFGGRYDLDSLDALLLVSSVEKEFGIKIPDETIGRQVFDSVRALAAYVDEHAT